MANQFGQDGWTPDRVDNLNGKTFLITGANSGTGFEAAKIIARKGAEVIMLNRNESKSKKAIADIKSELGDGAKLSWIKTDLSSLELVRKAADEINNKVSNIDALICNAAIAQVPKQVINEDGFESHLGVNHYGHFLLCGLLYDKIESSKGRIVVVASEGYKMGLKTIQFDDMNWDKKYHPMNVYCHSKLAQMMFAYELQDKIAAANKDTKVYVCHPGASKTSLIENSAGKMDKIIFKIMSMLPLVQSAEKGSYPEVMCATEAAENLNQKSYYGPTGTMNWKGPVGECKLEEFAQDKAVCSKLWEVSEEATGYKWTI